MILSLKVLRERIEGENRAAPYESGDEWSGGSARQGEVGAVFQGIIRVHRLLNSVM
jgi:hypothetical protein